MYTRMNKTVFIVIDLTPDFNFFCPRNLAPYKSTSLTLNNSFTLNFSVYTRSYTVFQVADVDGDGNMDHLSLMTSGRKGSVIQVPRCYSMKRLQDDDDDDE